MFHVKQFKFFFGAAIIILLGYFVAHLELQDPYQISPIIHAASMTPAEIQQDPLRANTLTPEAAQNLYAVLKKTVSILKRNQIDYWVTCATLLGAVRHEAVIKTDDDVDLAIWSKDSERLLSLKREFSHVGLGIYKDRTSIKIYKIKGWHVRPKRFSFQVLPGVWFVRHKTERFPTLDIHPMCQEGEQIVCAFPKARQVFINEVYLAKDVYPLKQYRFGSIHVNGPRNPIPFLCRRYGRTWNDMIYFSSRHTPGTGQVFKVPLTDQLRKSFFHFGVLQDHQPQ